MGPLVRVACVRSPVGTQPWRTLAQSEGLYCSHILLTLAPSQGEMPGIPEYPAKASSAVEASVYSTSFCLKMEDGRAKWQIRSISRRSNKCRLLVSPRLLSHQCRTSLYSCYFLNLVLPSTALYFYLSPLLFLKLDVVVTAHIHGYISIFRGPSQGHDALSFD